MRKKDKIKVGISVGDLSGIGIEIILKTFEDSRMLDFCTPVVFASSKVVSYHKKTLGLDTNIHGIDQLTKMIPNKLNLFNVWKESPEIEIGKPNKASGDFAFLSLEKAVEALDSEVIDILLTAPIDKHNIQSEEFDFQGHTEYLESKLKGESLMILMTDDLRVGLITGHIPVKEVAASISEELIQKKVDLMHDSLKLDFNITKPRIAVLGLNPHCGDKGVIGTEDDEVVRPAIEKMQQARKLVYGPYPADSFFGSGSYKNFDGVMAMYHDQGLAPFKALSFGNGVNFTAGLERIRVSPDHGTAFEIAGKGEADHESFKQALFSGIEIFRTRSENINLEENKLKPAKEMKK